MKKSEFELILSKLETYEKPVEVLEQYQTPAGIVADIVYRAYLQGNVKDKRIVDLGCGCGLFALAAGLLGAEKVYGVEIDEKALEVARRNQTILEKDYELPVEWMCTDILNFHIPVDVIFQNPPFGIKRKNYDRIFLRKAVELAPVVYSLHMSNPETKKFINSFTQTLKARIVSIDTYDFVISRVYKSHRKRAHHIKVDLYLVGRDEDKKNQMR